MVCNLAISYIRFSTRRQELGDSKRRQVDRTEAFCRRHVLNLDPSYSFEDLGVSAFLSANSRKGDLAVFLDMMRAGKIPTGAVLVIESLDRLSRDKWRSVYRLIDEILAAGVRIGNIARDRILTEEDLNDPFTIMEMIMESGRSRDESEMKSVRGKAVWGQRREKMSKGIPVTAHCAPWLKLKDDRSGFIMIRDRVELMRRIYRMSLEGMGSSLIARQLNKEGKTTFDRGNKWYSGYVHILLKDRRVLGDIETHVVQDDARVPIGTIKGFYPPIIDEETYSKVQLGMRQRSVTRGRAEKNRVNLFRGLLWDAVTGDPMGFETNNTSYKGKSIKRLRLVCRVQDGTNARKSSFQYKHFEQAFLKFVVELKPSDFTVKGNTLADQVVVLSGRLTLSTEKIEATKEAIKEAKDAKSIKPLLGILTDLETERDSIKAAYDEASIMAKNPVAEAVADAQSLISLLATADDADSLKLKIRSRIRQLVESVWLYVWDGDNHIRYGIAQVFFHDKLCRQFWTAYSLTPRPFIESLGVDQRFVPDNLGDLKTLRERLSPETIKPTTWPPRRKG